MQLAIASLLCQAQHFNVASLSLSLSLIQKHTFSCPFIVKKLGVAWGINEARLQLGTYFMVSGCQETPPAILDSI